MLADTHDGKLALYGQASAFAGSDDRRRGRCSIGTIWRAKWDLAVFSQLAEPGRMVLIPVVGREGQIADFEWHCATPSAASMFGCPGEDLTGRTLRHVLGAGALCDVLFATYQRAFLSRVPQSVEVEFRGWRGRHDACTSAAGLTVVLTAASALERVVAAQRSLRELEEVTPDGTVTPGSRRPDDGTASSQSHGAGAA